MGKSIEAPELTGPVYRTRKDYQREGIRSLFLTVNDKDLRIDIDHTFRSLKYNPRTGLIIVKRVDSDGKIEKLKIPKTDISRADYSRKARRDQEPYQPFSRFVASALNLPDRPENDQVSIRLRSLGTPSLPGEVFIFAPGIPSQGPKPKILPGGFNRSGNLYRVEDIIGTLVNNNRVTMSLQDGDQVDLIHFNRPAEVLVPQPDGWPEYPN